LAVSTYTFHTRTSPTLRGKYILELLGAPPPPPPPSVPALDMTPATAGGKTLTGTTASLAWGAVHLTLLSTGEDRGKALVDWTWAGFTHERAKRMTVRTDGD
jgi:hypothetical protein